MALSPYSLGARCLAEFIGMIFVIGMGESALANELLPNTKGHGMGWGWAVFTFGLSFFTPLQIFAPVSAKLNPAMCLAQWITGNLNGVDFVCLSLSEVAGAFVGAVLMWLHFLPHFKTLPEPPPDGREDQLLRVRDAYREDQMNIMSYNTRSDRKVVRPTLRSVVDDLTFYFKDPAGGKDTLSSHNAHDVLDSYFVAHAPLQHAQAIVQPNNRALGRRTVQVADLQNHVKNLHVESVVRRRVCLNCENGADAQHFQDDRNDREVKDSNSLPDKGTGRDIGRSLSFDQMQQQHPGSSAPFQAIDVAALEGNGSPSKAKADLQKDTNLAMAVIRAQRRSNALFTAALEADRCAKLSIFATRPAIYSPIWNFYAEASGTVFLLLTSLLIELSVRFLPLEQQPIFRICVQPLLLSFNIVVLIAGLGGVTGYAVNPARDLGPRLAHWLLPIPNKGHSEWVTYAWIPVLAPLVGACVTGGLYWAIEELLCPGGGVHGPAVCP